MVPRAILGQQRGGDAGRGDLRRSRWDAASWSSAWFVLVGVGAGFGQQHLGHRRLGSHRGILGAVGSFALFLHCCMVAAEAGWWAWCCIVGGGRVGSNRQRQGSRSVASVSPGMGSFRRTAQRDGLHGLVGGIELTALVGWLARLGSHGPGLHRDPRLSAGDLRRSSGQRAALRALRHQRCGSRRAPGLCVVRGRSRRGMLVGSIALTRAWWAASRAGGGLGITGLGALLGHRRRRCCSGLCGRGCRVQAQG